MRRNLEQAADSSTSDQQRVLAIGLLFLIDELRALRAVVEERLPEKPKKVKPRVIGE